MAHLEIRVPHQLEKSTAIDRLRQYSIEVRAQYSEQVRDFREDWDESGRLVFSFSVMGMAVSGTTVATEEDVHVQMKLPFAAIPFRGMIEREVAQRIEAALS